MDPTVAPPPARAWPPPPPPPPPPPDRQAHLRAEAIGRSSAGLVGIGAGLIVARAFSIHAPRCPFRAITGVPCPGCGMTRLADAVAHGHVARALGVDPAGVGILLALLVLAALYVIPVKLRGRPVPALLRSWAVPIALAGLVAVHWITTIVTGGLPST